MRRELIIDDENLIKSKIHKIREKQVMLDSDLAELFGVDTKRLNEQVKRNIARFPEDYMFSLTAEEFEILKSQNATSRSQHGGRRTLPNVFTEYGIVMLSSVLKSDIAISMSLKITKAFVSMRKFLIANGELFQRLNTVEKRQLAYEIKSDENFEKLFKAIESNNITPEQGIFYDGQIFSAYKFVNDIIRAATTSIVLIDNYIDDTILTMFSINPNIKYTLYTKKINTKLKLDIQKYNQEYKNLNLRTCSNVHDRFLIVDNKDVYQIGASLKDLGKKVFGFFKSNEPVEELLKRIK